MDINHGCQKYQCKDCFRYFQEHYTYLSYIIKDKQIITLTKESYGIRSTERILAVSPNHSRKYS